MSSHLRPLAGALAAAALALAPATLPAQSGSATTAPGDHVVRRGDTLWDLSRACLGDPFRWPELHQANRETVENPHRIYPGERLRMPCAPPADATRAETDAAPPEGRAASTPAVVGGLSFGSRVPAGSGTERGAAAAEQDGLQERTRLDYLTAPHARPAATPPGAGRVLAMEQSVRASAGLGRRFLLGDEVRVEMPAGVAPEPGVRLVAQRQVATLPGGVAVVRPTGVVEVREFEGGLVRGRVVQLMDAMEAGQELRPLPAVPPAGGAGAAGARSRVTWIADGALLPSIQDWILLEPASGALAEGDVVELLNPVPVDAGQAPVDEVVATARVVRVTPLGASAILTSVRKALVRPGTAARAAAGGGE